MRISGQPCAFYLLAVVRGPVSPRSGGFVIGGGCLGGDAGGGYRPDARAFAVALVKPPAPGVPGCEAGLCIIGLHAPHVDITEGADTVAAVCGEARHKCTVVRPR